MERVPERWLDPPDPGPAVCDYCGKETDPDEMEGIQQPGIFRKNKYACPTCHEKEACADCGRQADEDFSLDSGECRCEACFYSKFALPCCGELPEHCECKWKGTTTP